MTVDELRMLETAVVPVSMVAALLGEDERTVRRACAEGQLPSIHVGARLLIPRERLLAMLTAETAA